MFNRDKIRRWVAAVISVVLFLTNSAFAGLTEANIWKERQDFRNHSISVQAPRLPSLVPFRSFPANGSSPDDVASVLTALPVSLGSVREIKLPQQKHLRGVIVHIQDVHLNSEAQSNIDQTLNALIGQGKLGLIALEGVFSAVDLDRYRRYPRQEVIRQVADFYLRSNKISGAVHAAFTARGQLPPIIGIDDREHYDANVDAYRNSVPQVQAAEGRLSLEENRIAAAKKALFGRPLLDFDSQVEFHRKGQLDLAGYIGALAAATPPTFSMESFLEAVKAEREIDFKAVERERTRLLNALGRKISQTDMSALASAGAAFQSGNLRHSDFYSHLKKLCDKNGIALDQFPAMNAYIQYVLLSESISVDKLLKDAGEAENKIYAELAKTPQERTLVAETKHNYLSKKLVRFELTKEEWNEYRLSTNDEVRSTNLKSFEDFYHEAEIRDDKMADNLIRHSSFVLRTSMAVLVTGGFHSSGIDQRLAAAGYAVISFVPKITHIENENGSSYLSVFTQQKEPLNKLFEGEKLFVVPNPVAIEGFMEGVAGSDRLADPNEALAVLNPESPERCRVLKENLNERDLLFQNTRNGASEQLRIRFNANRIQNMDWDFAGTGLRGRSLGVSPWLWGTTGIIWLLRKAGMTDQRIAWVLGWTEEILLSGIVVGLGTRAAHSLLGVPVEWGFFGTSLISLGIFLLTHVGRIYHLIEGHLLRGPPSLGDYGRLALVGLGARMFYALPFIFVPLENISPFIWLFVIFPAVFHTEIFRVLFNKNADLAVISIEDDLGRPIQVVAKDAGILPDELEFYGPAKAKIALSVRDRLERKGKLISITAITPTKAGEGKTTTTIALTQGIGRLLKELGNGKKVMAALREPSMGPVFGAKGGAIGAGKSRVIPSNDINFHFTGDIHAITTANNLLSAMIDNNINNEGNPHRIAEVTWPLAMDMNYRELRDIELNHGRKKPRESGFVITAASEIMAIMALARDRDDLEKRLSRIIVGTTADGAPVTAMDVGAVGAMSKILFDSLKPNIVQTLEGQPVLVHMGPFANIAHGNNSVIATDMALRLSDYVITESGFGSDLGAEKLYDIVARNEGFHPDLSVLVATVRAIKMHGGVREEDLTREDIPAILRGFGNLEAHIKNLRQFGMPVLVAINRFPSDTDAEIDAIREWCRAKSVECEISNGVALGSEGTKELAKKALDMLENRPSNFHQLYPLDLPLREKMDIIARKVYGLKGVEFTPEAEAQLNRLQEMKVGGMEIGKLPVNIAKTQYSFTDDPKKGGLPSPDSVLKITEVKVSAGAGFVVAIAGDMMLMPGLPKDPSAKRFPMRKSGNAPLGVIPWLWNGWLIPLLKLLLVPGRAIGVLVGLLEDAALGVPVVYGTPWIGNVLGLPTDTAFEIALSIGLLLFLLSHAFGTYTLEDGKLVRGPPSWEKFEQIGKLTFGIGFVYTVALSLLSCSSGLDPSLTAYAPIIAVMLFHSFFYNGYWAPKRGLPLGMGNIDEKSNQPGLRGRIVEILTKARVNGTGERLAATVMAQLFLAAMLRRIDPENMTGRWPVALRTTDRLDKKIPDEIIAGRFPDDNFLKTMDKSELLQLLDEAYAASSLWKDRFLALVEQLFGGLILPLPNTQRESPRRNLSKDQRPLSILGLDAAQEDALIKLGIDSIGKLIERSRQEIYPAINFSDPNGNPLQEKMTALDLQLKIHALQRAAFSDKREPADERPISVLKVKGKEGVKALNVLNARGFLLKHLEIFSERILAGLPKVGKKGLSAITAAMREEGVQFKTEEKGFFDALNFGKSTRLKAGDRELESYKEPIFSALAKALRIKKLNELLALSPATLFKRTTNFGPDDLVFLNAVLNRRVFSKRSQPRDVNVMKTSKARKGLAGIIPWLWNWWLVPFLRLLRVPDRSIGMIVGLLEDAFFMGALLQYSTPAGISFEMTLAFSLLLFVLSHSFGTYKLENGELVRRPPSLEGLKQIARLALQIGVIYTFALAVASIIPAVDPSILKYAPLAAVMLYHGIYYNGYWAPKQGLVLGMADPLPSNRDVSISKPNKSFSEDLVFCLVKGSKPYVEEWRRREMMKLDAALEDTPIQLGVENQFRDFARFDKRSFNFDRLLSRLPIVFTKRNLKGSLPPAQADDLALKLMTPGVVPESLSTALQKAGLPDKPLTVVLLDSLAENQAEKTLLDLLATRKKNPVLFVSDSEKQAPVIEALTKQFRKGMFLQSRDGVFHTNEKKVVDQVSLRALDRLMPRKTFGDYTSIALVVSESVSVDVKGVRNPALQNAVFALINEAGAIVLSSNRMRLRRELKLLFENQA